LGEFSPFELLLTLGSLIKLLKYVGQIFAQLFSRENMCEFRHKIDWATRWAIFSKTNLVTLPLKGPLLE
jgi:hypothetical protein